MHLADAIVSPVAAAIAVMRFALGAAIRATTRGVGKPFLGVELLLTSGEYETTAAIAASQGFVCVAHFIYSLQNQSALVW